MGTYSLGCGAIARTDFLWCVRVDIVFPGHWTTKTKPRWEIHRTEDEQKKKEENVKLSPIYHI